MNDSEKRTASEAENPGIELGRVESTDDASAMLVQLGCTVEGIVTPHPIDGTESREEQALAQRLLQEWDRARRQHDVYVVTVGKDDEVFVWGYRE